MMKKNSTPAMMFFLLVLLILPQQVKSADQVEPKALFEMRCSRCHTLDRTNRTETSDNWKALVSKMKSKWLSGISDQEADVIAQYLIENRGKK